MTVTGILATLLLYIHSLDGSTESDDDMNAIILLLAATNKDSNNELRFNVKSPQGFMNSMKSYETCADVLLRTPSHVMATPDALTRCTEFWREIATWCLLFIDQKCGR